jgi:hypothetical protein
MLLHCTTLPPGPFAQPIRGRPTGVSSPAATRPLAIILANPGRRVVQCNSIAPYARLPCARMSVYHFVDGAGFTGDMRKWQRDKDLDLKEEELTRTRPLCRRPPWCHR